MNGCISRLCSRIAGSRPHERKISMVRVLMPEAFGKIDVPGCFSTTRDATPCRARPIAVVNPAGPAPTIRTGTLAVLEVLEVVIGLLQYSQDVVSFRIQTVR